MRSFSEKKATHSHFAPHIFTFLLFLLPMSLLLLSTSLYAQSWYIKPSSEIPIRRGQGTDYKIVAVLSNDTEVTIVEEQPPWVRIKTQKGREGWMLKRYLSDQQPLYKIVEELRLKNDELQEQAILLKEEVDSASVMINQITSERNTCTTSLSKTKADYQFLERETANVMAIRNNLIKSEKEVEELSSQLKQISEENIHLKRSQKTRWYMAGAGTLILGWLAGMMSIRSKKKRSSLY